MKTLLKTIAVALPLVGIGACGGGTDTRADTGAADEAAAPAPERDAGAGEAAGPASAEVVARGESLFQSKGCVACHKIGEGRLVGPDLAGVGERRDDAWIIGMIIAPDSMLRNDETARALLAEYFTPMAPMGVTADEARALLAFLKTKNDSAGDGGG